MASVAQRAAVAASSVSQIASSARNASSRPTATCHVASPRVHLGSDFVSKSASSAFQGVRITLAKSQSSRNSRSATRAVVVAAGGSAKLPSLNELPLLSYINQQGRIVPPVEPGTTASVFAVLDKNKKVQYIGFSKDVRNSLRTLMGRRPEFCYYYKLYNLSTMDQQQMIDIRAQWFSEMGIPPVGNTDPVQRGYWERPADAGSISERGKVAAAQSKAKTLLQMMVDRGLKEEMEYDPKLIEEGKCDVLPSKSQSAEELAAAAAEQEASAARVVHISETAPSGEVIEFDLTMDAKIKTNGGWMYDLYVTKDDKETRHRIVLGRVYSEAVNLPEDAVIARIIAFLLDDKETRHRIVLGRVHSEAVNLPEDAVIARIIAFLLYKRIPRQTEGVLTSDQFPINYFAVSEVAQKFAELGEWFPGGDLPDNYWRFNRIHEYGNVTAPVSTQEAPQLYSPKY
ncbi:unnamed protein product [Closterium sp. NIES-64]|nr:unnamed protein product [Closterium sp. NIES-64]CAI6000785.1 unnamed protein product [Closterium sp. NIES-64]